MKHLFSTLMLSSAVAFSTLSAQSKKIDAFPGAEGAGRYTTGGRGGAVYHVTSLADDGSEGTLRWAINKKGARTIVFDVAGTIELKSVLKIQNGDLTIAGQTAPGDGICLRNRGFQIAANNVIVRYIRSRCGDSDSECEDDAISAFSGGNGLSDIIIDHCSASWSVDECVSCYGVKNLTVQWCFITESLYNSIHGKGAHGYGGIWGGCPSTFHHNLLAHHSSRNPRLCGSRFNNDAASEMVDLRNNVFYNFGPTNGGYAGEGGCYNFINNAYKPGPMTATKSSLCNRIFQASPDDGTNKQAAGVWGTFHLSGNWFDTSCPSLTAAEVTAGEKVNIDNWLGLHVSKTPTGGKTTIESNTAFACASVTTHSAQDAMERVLEYAGCSYSRDAIDARIAYEVENGTYTYTGSKGGTLGLIDTPSDTEGYLTYTCTAAQKNALTDSNNNGIPDDMEDRLFGGEVTANGHDKDANYTNLEYYLNYLVRNITTNQLEGGTPSVDGTADGNNGSTEDVTGTEAFIATTTEVGGYNYYWFNSDNADKVNSWIADGTITLSNGSFSKAFSNDNTEYTGSLQLKSGTGEVVFKCPSVAEFALYMFRTGSFAGEVLTSTDGVNYESVSTFSGSKYILELDLTSQVASSSPIYVKVTNTSSGSLNIQGAKIVSYKSDGTSIDGVRLADGVIFASGSVSATNALNVRAYSLNGACVAAADGGQLSLEELPRGIYTVRVVKNDGRIVVRKVVK
jgi:hypothetical protein